MTLSAFTDEIEHLTDETVSLLRATAVCEAVISHPATDPKFAGRVWLLGQAIGQGPAAKVWAS